MTARKRHYDLVQGSEAWHGVRGHHLGASDIPIILGLSTYKTPLQLWKEKTGKVSRETKTSFQAQKGKDLEPIILEKACVQTGLSFTGTDTVFSRDFMLASLDGWDEDTNTVLEIKVPKAEHHEKALEGVCPEVYYAQVQAQLFVMGAKEAIYYSHDAYHGKPDAIVTVHRNDEYLEDILEDIKYFWSCVQNQIEPEISATDFKFVENEPLNLALRRYKELKAEADAIKKLMDNCKETIEGIVRQEGHPKVATNHGQVSLVTRKGNVDYKKIPALEGVDLEPYRRKPSTYYKIT